MVGREHPVTAFEVLDRKGALKPTRLQMLQLHRQALSAYEQYEFALALSCFDQALAVDPDDGLLLLYVDRCRRHRDDPPPDLVYRPRSK